ncbi:MAG: DUF2007 domain-containing protein [Betaproteobacteria bacterium]|nr:DUF2007 domain-containing protein [Betaproteobacteria bacterium]MBI2960684.1 DUF2007 domain-containing protein [Betaproteobacteria bacterium]
MKPVYTSLSLLEIHHLRNLLLSAGIPCRIRNERLSTLAGEVPFTECAMALELERESDRDRAESLIREMAQWSENRGASWRCSRCGEQLEAQFTACWRCGAEKPS